MVFFGHFDLFILQEKVFEAFHVWRWIQGSVFSLFEDLVDQFFGYFHSLFEILGQI